MVIILFWRFSSAKFGIISLLIIISFFWSCSGGWTISGTPLNLHDPRLLAMAAAERHFLEAEYEEYATANTSGASFCRSTALIVSLFPLMQQNSYIILTRNVFFIL